VAVAEPNPPEPTIAAGTTDSRPTPIDAGSDPADAIGDPVGDTAAIAVADTGNPAPVAAEVGLVGPGELRSAELLGTTPANEIAAALAADQTKLPALVPLYAVRSYRLTYATLDGRGREVVASGLVSVPLKGDGARSPVLSYQHGTIFFDAEAPSNNAVASEPPLVVASLGYIVVAADYVGYGASRGIPHPYLAAAPTASAVLDLLTAAETWRRRNGVLDNGQLFLAGYSEGGYATMAAHRALQAGSSAMAAALLGSTPGAGPYHVGVTLDVLLDRVRDDNPLLGNLLSPGLLRYLGSSVRREVRKQLVDALVPDDADVEFQTDFIDHYLADDDDALERCCNVHDWNPRTPVRMYHGRDDQTVPYAASLRTLQTMLSRGSSFASLTDCSALPSSHIGCVPPYVQFLLGVLAGDARDL
jgi:pimeloyl-ACP methyl ester carboxylesterase